MICLTEQDLLGTGRHRKCYAHPNDAKRCIKIVYNTGSGGDKELVRELKYYQHLSGYLKDWTGLPRYHGTIETNLGTGYVYDMVKDFNGSPSVTLSEFIAQCQQEGNLEKLPRLLEKLKHYLHDNNIVTMTLKPYNILCRRISESETTLVVCDNIGEGTLIPLATWSHWLCHRKQARLWHRFIKSLAPTLPSIQQ